MENLEIQKLEIPEELYHIWNEQSPRTLKPIIEIYLIPDLANIVYEYYLTYIPEPYTNSIFTYFYPNLKSN